MSMFFMIWILIALFAIASIPFLPLYYSCVRLWNRLPEKTQNKTKGWAWIAGGGIIMVLSLALFVYWITSLINGETGFGMFIFGQTLYFAFVIPVGLLAICDGVFKIKNPLQEDGKINDFTKTKLFDKLMTPYSIYLAMLISVGWLYWAYYIFQIAKKEYDGTVYYIASVAMVLGYIGLIINAIITRRKNARKANQI